MKETDIERTFMRGAALAAQQVRADREITPVDIIWALFCEAVATERSLPRPPRVSRPTKSAWPPYGDEVTYWQKLAAYLRGETLEMPDTAAAKIGATAEQMTTHDFVMDLFHRYALRGASDWKRKRKALWAYASGRSNYRVREEFGVTRMGLSRLKKQAMTDILRGAEKNGCY